MIKENALKMALVEPDTVTIRSGHEPSDMLIFAPDFIQKKKKQQYEKFERTHVDGFDRRHSEVKSIDFYLYQYLPKCNKMPFVFEYFYATSLSEMETFSTVLRRSGK